MITITNESCYPTRRVKAIVRRALRDLDVEHGAVTVMSGKRLRGLAWRRTRRVSIWLPDEYPQTWLAYPRRDGPDDVVVTDWEEALVVAMAHEGMHLRQYQTWAPAREVDCDWAAVRAIRRWRESKR